MRLKTFKVAVNHGDAVFKLRKSRLKRFITKDYNMYDRTVYVSSKVASEMSELGVRCDEIISIPIILDNHSFRSAQIPGRSGYKTTKTHRAIDGLTSPDALVGS